MTGERALTGGWPAVGAAGLAMLAISQDGNMVIASLPRLGPALGLAPSGAVWLVLASLLASVSLLLPAGRWADHSDNRTGFLVGTAGFAASATIAGLAPSVPVLFVARALEGGFTALLLVLVMSIAVQSAGDSGRGRAVGLMTAVGPLGAMLGPQVAAILLPAYGWRAIFLVAVPISLAAAGLGYLFVPTGGRLLPPRPRWLLEAGALGLAVAGIFAALHETGSSNPRWVLVGPLLVGAAFCLIMWSRLPQARGVQRLLGARHMWFPLACLMAMAGISGVVGYLVPFLMIGHLHRSLAEAGIAFISLSFGMTVTSSIGGVLIDRWGGWPVAVAGALLMAVGVAVMLPLDSNWGTAEVSWRVGVLGLGMGLVAGANHSAVMGLAPHHHAATASASSLMLRYLSYSVGAAVAAILVTAMAGLPGIRAGLELAFAVSIAALVPAILVRATMARLDDFPHHPVPHPGHQPLHTTHGLAGRHHE